MHLIGRVRNRFFKIFFTKKVNRSGGAFPFQHVAVRPPAKSVGCREVNARTPSQRLEFSPLLSGLYRAACLLAAAWLTSCATPQAKPNLSGPGERTKTVYVVHHGTLHTGLTVKRSDIPVDIWPANQDYGGSKFIEVGWGDDDGYRKPLTSGIAIKALAGSKRTVLLTDGFSQPPLSKYSDPKFTVLAVDLSDAGFTRLCEHVGRTYALDDKQEPIRLGGGWYRARGTYSAFNTCNTWVAVGLQKAGCPLSPAFCSLPNQLLGRVRPFARKLKTARAQPR